MATVAPEIACDDGRCSGGSHKRFFPSYVIQVTLLSRPYPANWGKEAEQLAGVVVEAMEVVPDCKSSVPSSVCK